MQFTTALGRYKPLGCTLTSRLFSSCDFTHCSTEQLIQAIPSLSIPLSANLTDTSVLVVGASVGGLATAACLRAAGFSRVQVVEKVSQQQSGAGLGVDDVSIGILKGLGALTTKPPALQKLRWTEERTAEGHTISRQPFPYFAARYSEIVTSLAALLPQDAIRYSCGVESITTGQGGEVVKFLDGTSEQYDMVVAADGPRSALRQQLFTNSPPELRFAKYSAWRGVIPESSLPAEVLQSFRSAFPLIGNCIYFVHASSPRQSSVVYDIGNGLINWLIYENRDVPTAAPGRTTSMATDNDIALLQARASAAWGPALGAVIAATEEPFMTDVYDIQNPLERLASGRCCVLGDAAHPTTPHMAKGSNLALHDAFTLAHAAQNSSSVSEMLAAYSDARADETGRTLLLSRHLGRLRNGLLHGLPAVPSTDEEFTSLVRTGGLGTLTLPVDDHFQPVWQFVDENLPADQRGCFLSPDKPSIPAVQSLNHVSVETRDVKSMCWFYKEVLGLEQLNTRPDFGFGGAWFQISPHTQLHIIEKDQHKPVTIEGNVSGDSTALPPESFIRRSHHFAFTVMDVEATKLCLRAHGIEFAVNSVPGTPITQLFVYDPDGNGIEIGDFDRVK